MRIANIAIIAAVLTSGTLAAQAQPPSVKVFKTPTCRCCSKWVAHLRQHGFTVTTTDMPDVSGIRKLHNVPRDLSSCHTAVVGGYVVEGHVPAADVQRLVKGRPAIAGIAVPGMPMGSPGMEGPTSEPYDVIAFDKQGKTRVFASHRP